MDDMTSKQTSEDLGGMAAEQDAAFRAAVQQAIDDPRPRNPHAEVEAKGRRLIA
jgi:hypothetical protein